MNDSHRDKGQAHYHHCPICDFEWRCELAGCTLPLETLCGPGQCLNRARRKYKRVYPTVPANFACVLDVGCGSGLSLQWSNMALGAVAVGVDIDLDALAKGRMLRPHFSFVCATAESLPFRDGAFDAVISRAGLPYMDIPVALREMHRVLKSHGSLWASLLNLRFACRDGLRRLGSLNPINAAFAFCTLMNGLFFHVTGKLFRFPLRRARCESFQTGRGIRLALHRAGFDHIEFHRDRYHSSITARRSG